MFETSSVFIFVFFSSRRRHTRCALVTGVQTCALPILRLGGYMVESNCGHIGDDIDARAGDDPTLYGYRAGVEAARFSKHVAKQVYGREPDYSYVWGGSGGGRRSQIGRAHV